MDFKSESAAIYVLVGAKMLLVSEILFASFDWSFEVSQAFQKLKATALPSFFVCIIQLKLNISSKSNIFPLHFCYPLQKGFWSVINTELVAGGGLPLPGHGDRHGGAQLQTAGAGHR